MKKLISTLFIATGILAASASDAPKTSVVWETLGNVAEEKGANHYTQRFIVSGDLDFDRLGFNMFARKMRAVNPADTIVEIFPGYYYIRSPRLASGADSIHIDIEVRGSLAIKAYAPDGFHRINADGSTSPVTYTRTPITRADQWTIGQRDLMPHGPAIYDANAARATDYIPTVYDVIPSFKKVTTVAGESTPKAIAFIGIDPENPEYYRLTVRNDSIIVTCRPDRQWAIMNHFNAKVLMPNQGRPLPNVEIENWPDFPWRGLHIDIARNYQTPETMYRVLELMSANHLNKLHFHITDDEAWRLEIDGLPELTEIASRRGFSDHGEDQYLYQIFAGDGNPDTKTGSANGYWTRDTFKDFIRTAHSLGIAVLPEVESPGHARAAIRAMEARHRKGDSSYRLIHDGDTSKYTSAQSYHDNVMNPALPGPYKFMEKVFDEIIRLYDEAGVPLPGIHIGGDEVPRGAWSGSEIAQDFMREHGMTNQKELHAYFVRRISEMLAERKVPMFGWEEIAVGHGDDFNSAVAPTVGGVNCWHATPDAAMKSVRAGYPTILSNVNRLYLDMVYSNHPEEQGLNWGGTVDEFDALGAYASEMCPLPADSVSAHVIGLQGQLWAETLRNDKQLFGCLVPKMLGLAERAWNSTPTWTEAQFNAIIGEKELPVYTSGGIITPHMRQPGIKVIDGKVYMNGPYRDGEIRYTTDGSEPDMTSPIYSGPFTTPDPSLVRARYYRNGAQSVTTHP